MYVGDRALVTIHPPMFGGHRTFHLKREVVIFPFLLDRYTMTHVEMAQSVDHMIA